MTSDTAAAAAPDTQSLQSGIASASRALLDVQKPDHHWVFELEADVTIPSEYILMRHYFAEPVDTVLEQKIAKYLRRMQNDIGGWSLFYGHEFDMSASVKAYYALKLAGDSADAPHMKKAREAMLARGGAVKANVFTRIMLALFGQLEWKAVPMMPVEIMLLPRWFPFHLTKDSYWARTVIVPLLVLMTYKPLAKNPRGIGVRELFIEDPKTIGPTPKAAHQSQLWFTSFALIDRALRLADPLFPKAMRKRAIARAEAFVTERLNGVDGLGAIFPAMVNSIIMYDVLGYPESHPNRRIARESIERLLVIKDDEAYCQPCVSPVWDTALAAHTMIESGQAADLEAAKASLDWLLPRQVLDVKGDWADKRPNVRPGGWAFQYNNAHYPDLDDTAVVVMAMDRVRRMEGTPKYDDAIARAISMLAQLGDTLQTSEPMRRGVEYLRKTQLADGSWFGRWGINYIYGTWSVLCALNAAGIPHDDPMIARAADWLETILNPDGGWGEDGNSYKLDYIGYERYATTASQTAWATLAL